MRLASSVDSPMNAEIDPQKYSPKRDSVLLHMPLLDLLLSFLLCTTSTQEYHETVPRALAKLTSTSVGSLSKLIHLLRSLLTQTAA
jgi:hypothetical protein